MINYNEFLDELNSKNRFNHFDSDNLVLQHAYEYADYHHKGQKRAVSKDPYFVHPCRVAVLLRGYEQEIIVAGLLHDVVEDTIATLDDIIDRFGKKVAFLVDAVTKDNGDPIDKLSRYARSDKRVILVKLADRYDNITDGIEKMGNKIKQKYSLETARLLKLSESYNIDFLHLKLSNRLPLLQILK